MAFDLVVVVPFAGYTIGTRITDATTVSSVLASPSAGLVVRVTQGQPDPSPVLPDVSQIQGGGYLLRVGNVERFFSLADLQTFLTPLLGGSGTTPPDTTAPTILTAATLTVAENTAFSVALTASEAVTWTKTGGADAALFTLSGATLSMIARDYEAPADANADNAYVVTVTATDAAGNVSSPKTITVTVTDVAEGTSPSGGTMDFSVAANSGLIAAIAA